MIYLLCVLLNVPASPAVSVQAPIPRSGLVHEARSSFSEGVSEMTAFGDKKT
jgi:hypothetical protein